MSLFSSGNPILNDQTFSTVGPWGNLGAATRPGVMSVRGAASATMILLGIVAATAMLVWTYLLNSPFYFAAALGGGVLGCILVTIAHWKPKASAYLALPIAVAEGAFAGGMSIFWSHYIEGRVAAGAAGTITALGTGLVVQSFLLTMAIATGVLLLNMTNVARATPRFVAIFSAAMFGLFAVSMLSWILAIFHIRVPYIWDNGIIGIAFAGFVVVLASSSLVMDFDQIRLGAANGYPKYMEWLSAIGLLVTLVWLYTSILRLLAQLNRRD